MKMKIFKTILLLLLCCLGLLSFAQQGAVAGGGQSSGGNGDVSFSIGQVEHMQLSNSTLQVLQGIQQASEVYLGPKDSLVIVAGPMLTAFPNPTRDKTTLYVQNGDPQYMSYIIHDINGKQVETKKLTERRTVINMSQLTNTLYIITVIDSRTKKPIQQLKVIKIP
jgi:hypothetical protein